MTHASVFSGIGGPEVAATMLGWENLFHCEINPFGRHILDYYYPQAESYEDITKTDFTKWRGKVNVLTGGFPCQPFSYAGKRRGATDDRYLWPYMFRCIDQVQPDWVVCENVAGILTMVEQGDVSQMEDSPALFGEDGDLHRYKYKRTFTLERICDDLENHGYEVQAVLIPACAVGAPHRRDRVFIVGHRLSSDTDGHRGCEVDKRLQPKLTDGSEPVSVGRKWHAPDTECERLEGCDESWSGQTWQWLHLRGNAAGHHKPSCKVGSRWEGWPTVSPVHRRDDGLPFPVDNLTIPFAQWRNESIKAYGNAIVPQVMYEIFRAIEQQYNQ